MTDFHKAQERFASEYGFFIAEGERIASIVNKIFARDQITLPTAADTCMFLLGYEAWKDFEELVVLAENGLSRGALKSLRGMYEKVVTALYLSNHPEKAAAFSAYASVQQHRLLSELPVEMQDTALGAERANEIEQEYAQVKSQFKREDKWTSLPMKDLAKQAGDDLEGAYAPAYALPSCFVHASAAALKRRVRNENGVMRLVDEAGSPESTLYHAHLLLLKLLRRLDSRLQFGLQSEIEDAIQRFSHCWNPANRARAKSDGWPRSPKPRRIFC